jgi:hypothetical protein
MDTLTGFIPAQAICAYGGEVEALLRRVSAYSAGEAQWQDILRSVLERRAFLLAALDGEPRKLTALAVLRIVAHPCKTVLFIDYAVGKDATRRLFPLALEAAKATGCDAIEAICRPSAARLSRRFGFDDSRRVISLAVKETDMGGNSGAGYRTQGRGSENPELYDLEARVRQLEARLRDTETRLREAEDRGAPYGGVEPAKGD